LPVLFERDNPENETGIDHINFDTKHVRIIVIDINLRESQNTQDAKILYPTIESVLKKLNPVGPYYLIFWSRYKALPEEIVNYFSARSKDEITAPIGWGYLDKTEFQDDEDIEKLKETISNLIGEVCVFRLLLGWENRTSQAASQTLSDIYQIASSQNDNGWKIDDTKEKLIALLTHVAHGAIGHKNSVDLTNHAVETGLLPILEDNFLGMTSDEDIQTLNVEWKECLIKLGDTRALEDLSDEDLSNLNAFYNLEEVTAEYSKCKRGVFVTLADDVKEDRELFCSLFGSENSYKKLVAEEFLFNNDIGNKKFRNDLRGKIKLGWLEVGAACDHAQRKNRLHKYLLSALVPLECLEMVCKNSDSGISRKAHEGVYRSPLLQYKDEQYVLLVSFRYSAGLHQDSSVLDEPIFRLKEQIINEIAFTWSKHSIRPGITSFN
jgi:hypothetical protein